MQGWWGVRTPLPQLRSSLIFTPRNIKHALQNTKNDCHQCLSDRSRVHKIRFRTGLHPGPRWGSLINANRNWTMRISTNHQPRSCVTPNFPKMGFGYPNLSFFCRNFDQKPLQVCYKVSLSKNFQRQSCRAINYLSNGIKTFWQGMTPFR